jgi:hypothetical protein
VTAKTDGKVPKTAKRPQPTGGSRKGVPNKTTKALKEMILGALDAAGGVDYLTDRANDPRTASAFLTLVGKVLPMTVAGDPENPLQTVTRIELVAPRVSRSA